MHLTPALLIEKHVVSAMPRQHVADGGADAGVGGDVEPERLRGWRASEVGDQAEVMPSLK